jgi:hypothetical protein
VFARAGAIVPQAPKSAWGGTGTPEQLQFNIFPGANGRFDLYDDEGNTNHYLTGKYAITPLVQEWSAGQSHLLIGPAEGETSLLPARRQFDLQFRGYEQPTTIEVRLNGTPVPVEAVYQPETATLAIPALMLAPADRLEVILVAAAGTELARQSDARLATCLKLLQYFRLENWTKAEMKVGLPEIVQSPGLLARYLPVLSESQQRALLETITGAGVHQTDSTGSPLILVWNNDEDDNVTQLYAINRLYEFRRMKERRPWTSGRLPRFQVIRPREEIGEKNPWTLQVNYYGLPGPKLGNVEG